MNETYADYIVAFDDTQKPQVIDHNEALAHMMQFIPAAHHRRREKECSDAMQWVDYLENRGIMVNNSVKAQIIRRIYHGL